MSFTTDYNTPIGQVRLLLSDLDPTNPIFPDDNQINTFLLLEDQSVKLSAALGLETIAGNRALTLQVVQLLDLKTDGRSTAQALLAVAKQMRDSENDDWAGFDFAQVVDDSMFVNREYMLKLWIQQNTSSY